MNTKLLVFALFGAAVVLLFTTDKGKEIREDIADSAEDWGDKLSELAEKASCSAKDLKNLVSKQVSGLTDEARDRIAAIIDEGSKSAKKMKKTAESQLS
jgi:gas vesicle protein